MVGLGEINKVSSFSPSVSRNRSFEKDSNNLNDQNTKEIAISMKDIESDLKQAGNLDS